MKKITNRVIRFALICAIGFPFRAVRADGTAEESPLSIHAERADSLYETGEPVTFVIRLKDADGAQVQWEISHDGVAPLQSGQTNVENGLALATALPTQAGFLQCEVQFKQNGKMLRARAGAGVAPDAIRPSLSAPDDFDSFWADQKTELAKVPLDTRLVPVGGPVATTAKIELLDVHASCAGGAAVSGYLARPKEAKRQSLPAILTLHGAGVKSAMRSVAMGWAKDGFLALDINAHGLPNGKPKSFYDALAQGDLKNYRLLGRESREGFYFRGMFLRVLRALDVLASQPEWDGRTLVIYGTSQGGAQAIAGAALDRRVSFLVAGVPAMCDHSGMMAGRVAGWPKLVPISKGTGEDGGANTPDAAVLKASRYYDMVNFAGRVQAPALFTVGFIDRTCPPTTVYAAFNALPGAKEIFNDIGAAHENTPEAKRRMHTAVINQITAGRMKPTAKASPLRHSSL